MVDPTLSSEPNAWLRQHWAELRRQPFFARLAPELQAAALAAAIEPDHPGKAAEIREWNLATRRAMLTLLNTAVLGRRAVRETALWTVTKGDRQLRCVSVYLSTGIDLRLLENGEMERTELLRDGPSAQVRARQWRARLGCRVGGRIGRATCPVLRLGCGKQHTDRSVRRRSRPA